MSKGFYKNRRLKSFIFLSACFLVAFIPHAYYIKNFLYIFIGFIISIVLVYILFNNNNININNDRLESLMDKYGSDKGTQGHYYADIYDVLLYNYKYDKNFKMLEIGIGTLENTESNMKFKESYKQGASLRAWGEYFSNGEVYGLDVAEDTQFTEKYKDVFSRFE